MDRIRPDGFVYPGFVSCKPDFLFIDAVLIEPCTKLVKLDYRGKFLNDILGMFDKFGSLFDKGMRSDALE